MFLRQYDPVSKASLWSVGGLPKSVLIFAAIVVGAFVLFKVVL